MTQPRPGSPEDPCEEYPKARYKAKGYGNRNFRNQPMHASRAAWIEAYGPIPNGLWVLHKCDNPPCCKLPHLYLGTAKDNTRDAMERGRAYLPGPNGVGMATRFPDGVAHWAAKLNPDKVREIRSRHGMGETQTALSLEFGVSRRTVGDVVNRKLWRSVP